MNIGIDFNIENIKACILNRQSDIDKIQMVEIVNVLTFVKGEIFIGNDGFNKFLMGKDAILYDLNRIVDLNGLIINKKQMSIERCLSLLFGYLLEEIQKCTGQNTIDLVCISIPYEKFYFWKELILKAFSILEIKRIRIISQPNAFFAQPNINFLLNRLSKVSLLQTEQKVPWYKKAFTQKQKGISISQNLDVFLFFSISKNNSNVSLVNYGDGVLDIFSTQYIDTYSERQFKSLVFDFFLKEIRKDKQRFLLEERKTIFRIQETVDDFLKTYKNDRIYEINIPYVLCEDGQYRTINVAIDLNSLNDYLNDNPIFGTFIRFIKKVVKQTQNMHGGIDAIIFIGEYFGYVYIRKIIENGLCKLFDRSKIVFENSNILAIGALSYSNSLSGRKSDYVALEVIPFSIFIRLRGGEFIELVKKDTAIPTRSKESSFEIQGDNKSKYVEVHLTTKEGNSFQSLNVWKIEVDNLKIFKVQVDVDENLEITLIASSQSGRILLVQRGTTFSFKGSGFEVGIKGKDIRQYILNQFNYLGVILKSDELTIFEPDSTFYSMLREGDPFKALRYLGYFLKLKSLPDVELKDSEYFREQGIAGFIYGSKINIPVYFKKDPYGFGYILAHELAHYILAHDEGIILDDEQENEILTEIFVIYKGMGKLFLNGFNTKEAQIFTPHARGYLDEIIIKYIHQLYFDKFGIDVSNYKNNLTKEGIKILSEFIPS